MKLRSALVAAGLVVLPAAAIAQPVDGLYVGAGAGYNYLQDQTVKRGGVGSTGGGGGFIGLASFGYGFGNGLRMEIEGNFRKADQSGSGGFGHSDTQMYGAFVNGLFDFDVGSDFVFPYAGLGVGVEGIREQGAVSGTRTEGEGQAILGVSFPIPDFAGLSVTAEYRFMSPFHSSSFNGTKLGTPYDHAGLLGLRYAFGVEPPPPPPAPAPVVAPAPAPARTYLVFFDWDKYDLNARARQIISEAASNATKVQVTRIEVSGYADLSGTHAYNQGLSQRRADTVAAELVRDGIAKSEIAVMAYGDSHPLVPTAPGVREPQNRRVEIVLK